MENVDPNVREWWNDPVQRARFEERMDVGGMSRRRVLGIIGAFAAGTALVACGGSDDEEPAAGGQAPAGGTQAAGQTGATTEKLAKEQLYRNTVTDEPSTFDYNFSLYAASSQYVGAQLLKFDPDLNAKPDLAESFSANDAGDVYTFKIRKGTKWSNGEDVKAGDFVYSYTRRLDPNSGADYKAFLYDIKNGKKFATKEISDPSQLGLKAIDDYTLEITLEQPAGYFPSLAAYTAAAVVNKGGVEKFGKDYGLDADKFIAAGPFKPSKWEHNKSFELVKNDGYWDAGNIKLQRVTSLIVKQDQRVPTYENDEIDVVPSANFGDLKRLQSDAKLSKEIFQFDQVGTWYLMPNPKFPPFDEPKVRLALAHAIDRDKLVKDVLQGLGKPAFTMNPAGTVFYNPNAYEQHTKFDPKMAMDLLKGTKYEGGKNWPNITMSVRNNEADAHRAAMAALIQMFKEHLGMNIDAEQGDPQALYKEMWQGNKQLMWLRWYMDYPDANNTSFECFYSKIPAGSRRSWWENADYDRLVEQGKSEPNLEKRKQFYVQADEVMIKDGGAVFAYYPLAYGLRKPYVVGVPKNSKGDEVPDWNIFVRQLETVYILEH
ncbi:MAG: peptide ABC transporter substrate-binding protein [Dehalococcoidia bacterium]